MSRVSNTPKPRRPSQATIWFLMLWHGAFSGAFFVAMLTGEGAYHAHEFAGIVAIFAIGVRLLVGAAIPKGHPLTFPLPSLKMALGGGTNGFRRFFSHLLGLVMLVLCALATLTGWYSHTDITVHGAISYFTLTIIGFHVVQVILFQGWKRLEGPPKPHKAKAEQMKARPKRL
ncbi:hypothetical protein ACFL12_07025 [Pseudomonadota bacterium]